MLNADMMLEATRLTRAGRAVEAAALLQRMFRGETAPDKSFGPAGGTTPPTIDVKAGTIGETDRPLFGATTSVQPDRFGGLRALFDRVRRRAEAPVPTADIVPPGGTFIEATCSNAAGTRSYKLYIPSGYLGQAIPLVVMLHGCTQSPDDFAAGTRMNQIAEEQTCLVAYPAQPSDANPAKCWNWFRPADQRRGQGEPSLIADITRKVMREYSVDPARVYIGGLSAGGAAAAIMGATYPDLYAAVGVHSGLACGAANDLPSAFIAMRQGDLGDTVRSSDIASDLRNGPVVPIIVFHGDRDTTVHPRNGDHVIARSRAVNWRKTVHQEQVPGGHSYTRTLHADPSGRAVFEHWEIHGAAHAWSGGSPAGSYTDPRGPDASREMLRFFLQHRAQPSDRRHE
ncbi:MAG TPA: PHB depolymerase family esterase [Xanthobacteraceae bacterium]|jgi:poly(hydroxyalkanoate) depolymerase family esterase|nr:PHB depolymerase family esterase [Xanthobacteraceae bacterium]